MPAIARAQPPFQAVADVLRRRLEAGEYAPGSDLPSAVALATDLNVSPRTVRRALQELDAAGLTAGGRGRPRIALGSGAGAGGRRHEHVAEGLRADVAAGHLSAGERLPTEESLTRQLGVSKHTVRAALECLQRDGVIVQRRGRRYVAGAVRPDTTYERVAEDLRRQFGATYRYGDRLPSEVALGERFEVSRETVRRALGLLSEQGLVEAQPRLGWFATHPREAQP